MQQNSMRKKFCAKRHVKFEKFYIVQKDLSSDFWVDLRIRIQRAYQHSVDDATVRERKIVWQRKGRREPS
uniref:Uncharacterized protein n=1 Tax=Romanomermis culicivorax TaxID=13658 RepID=A0A915KRR2_ROMCU